MSGAEGEDVEEAYRSKSFEECKFRPASNCSSKQRHHGGENKSSWILSVQEESESQLKTINLEYIINEIDNGVIKLPKSVGKFEQAKQRAPCLQCTGSRAPSSRK